MASATDAPLYLDASALVKLVVEEPQSTALRREVGSAAIVSSELALAEVPRAMWRAGAGRSAREQVALRTAAAQLLESVSLVPLDRDLLLTAGSFDEPFLRTLDAIHVASAISIADAITAFVTYDERQAKVARQAAFQVIAPA